MGQWWDLVRVRAAPVVGQTLSEGLLAARAQHAPKPRWPHPTLSACLAFHRHTPSRASPAADAGAFRPAARMLTRGRAHSFDSHGNVADQTPARGTNAPIGTSTMRQSRRATVQHATTTMLVCDVTRADIQLP
jgi:hypothetical protein